MKRFFGRVIVGAAVGAVLGFVILGPGGALLGAKVGAASSGSS